MDGPLVHRLDCQVYGRVAKPGRGYHVAVYDTITGHFIKGVTHQGLSDNSMWEMCIRDRYVYLMISAAFTSINP